MYKKDTWYPLSRNELNWLKLSYNEPITCPAVNDERYQDNDGVRVNAAPTADAHDDQGTPDVSHGETMIVDLCSI